MLLSPLLNWRTQRASYHNWSRSCPRLFSNINLPRLFQTSLVRALSQISHFPAFLKNPFSLPFSNITFLRLFQIWFFRAFMKYHFSAPFSNICLRFFSSNITFPGLFQEYDFTAPLTNITFPRLFQKYDFTAPLTNITFPRLFQKYDFTETLSNITFPRLFQI